MKSVQIWGFSLSVFSCIRTEYSVNLLIQSEYKKYGPEKTPYLDTFYAVEYTDNSKPVFLFLKSFFLEKTVLGLCSSCLLLSHSAIPECLGIFWCLIMNSISCSLKTWIVRLDVFEKRPSCFRVFSYFWSIFWMLWMLNTVRKVTFTLWKKLIIYMA